MINTCTVTNQADAGARRYIRRVARRNPGAGIVVAGCSAALRAGEYREMDGVRGVVEGHDPGQVLAAATRALGRSGLVQLGSRAPLERSHMEGVGAAVLRRRAGATRGWLKVQDGCDRKCAFCATRLAGDRAAAAGPTASSPRPAPWP